jgi:hypothetical protein
VAQLGLGRRLDFGNVFGGERFKFAANGVGGKTRGQQAAIEGGEFLLIEVAIRVGRLGEGKFAMDALANGVALGGFVGGIREGGLDVAIRDTAGAKIAGDAEFALFTVLRTLAGELFGITGVVELAAFFQAGHNSLDKKLVAGAALEEFFHFVNGVGAAHERAKGDGVEFGFGFELTGLGEHEKSIEVMK